MPPKITKASKISLRGAAKKPRSALIKNPILAEQFKEPEDHLRFADTTKEDFSSLSKEQLEELVKVLHANNKIIREETQKLGVKLGVTLDVRIIYHLKREES